MNKKMTVLEFLKSDIEVDICDDYTEQLYIAKCGRFKLTEKGLKYFKNVIDLIVDVREDIAILEINDFIFEEDGYVYGSQGEIPALLYRACELFEGIAGYCSVEDYDSWFIDLENDIDYEHMDVSEIKTY